jgi:hypothetical protein
MSLTSLNINGPTEIFPGFVLVPTGGLIHYVHASGAVGLDRLPPGMAAPGNGATFATSVASAMGFCRANRGDRIIVLPGHTENLGAAAWTWVAGVKVFGVGDVDNRPAFTWNAAGSTNVMSAANCGIDNCNLFLAGAHAAGSALTVAAPLTMSGDGGVISNCEIKAGFDADQIVTQGVTITGDRCRWINNRMFGALLAPAGAAFMDINAAHDLVMEDNTFHGTSSGVGVGIVRFVTAASLNIRLRRNTYINKLALSTCAVTGLAAVTGESRDEHFAYLDTTSLTAWLTSPGLMHFHRPTVSNAAGETGTEVVGTVSA